MLVDITARHGTLAVVPEPAPDGADACGEAFEEPEAALLQRAAAGDDAAWTQIFDEQYVRVYRYFRARVASHEQAEDLASQVFLEAFRSIGNFRWQGAPFGAWLFSIARRVLASYYRAKRPDVEPELCAHTRDEYLAVEVRDTLGRLPADYREALELRYILGLSGEEAAGAMGRTHGAFRALLLRAVRAYRAQMELAAAI